MLTSKPAGEANCPVCGGLYVRARRGQVYCSVTCRRAAKRERAVPGAKPTCPYCGEGFVLANSQQRFCSIACRKLAEDERRRSRRSGGPGKGWAKGVQIRQENSQWKGDKAAYSALHIRVKKARGRPFPCSRCGTDDSSKRYDWANLTGKFTDVNDYTAMCRSCHCKYDKKTVKRS